MIKILHSADWHIDSPINGFDPVQRRQLRQKLMQVPEQIAQVCIREGCGLVLLSGDLFDSAYTPAGYRAVYKALERMGVPVFISPGNHDYYGGPGPWDKEVWPDNVYIFHRNRIESVALGDMDVRVYGCAFTDMDCPALLDGFEARQRERFSVGVFHADPGQADSPYNPVTVRQVQDSRLCYMALGHIHKAGAFRAGDTLCAWPGCPMGTGYHETGSKGVTIVTLADAPSSRFVPLDVPNFYDIQIPVGENPAENLKSCLPALADDHFYRVTFTGSGQMPDLAALRTEFSQFPNLTLLDETTRPVELWSGAGTDSFEGAFFGMLKELSEQADPQQRDKILLAARLSRQILDGEEVALP